MSTLRDIIYMDKGIPSMIVLSMKGKNILDKIISNFPHAKNSCVCNYCKNSKIHIIYNNYDIVDMFYHHFIHLKKSPPHIKVRIYHLW